MELPVTPWLEQTRPAPPGAEHRKRLILEHLPLVKAIAAQIHEKLPPEVSRDDLVSAGILGLIAAVDNFDPERNAQLKTYAGYRIRGAILDSLRDHWNPGVNLARARQIEAAIQAAERRHQRTPSEEEIAAEMGLPLDEYHERLVQVRGLAPARLVQVDASDPEAVDALRFVPDDEDQWPSSLFERAELEKLVATALDRMPKTERTILTLYYYEELTLRQIAEVLKMHETRVWQLKAQAILRLRTFLRARWPGPGGC